jgi:hypothetical protein
MSASQRTKGHTFERQIANELKEIFPNARRGLQYRDGGECPDVEGTPFHIECKRGKKPNPRAALAQAIGDADESRVPVAVIRDDRAEAFIVMRWDDFKNMIGEMYARGNHHAGAGAPAGLHGDNGGSGDA